MQGRTRSPPEDGDSYAPGRANLVKAANIAPCPTSAQVVELSSCSFGERGMGITEVPSQNTRVCQSSMDLDQSHIDLDSGSVGRKKYQQSFVKEEDFKLCRNFSVKLFSHKACNIPNKKINSLKACNKDPDYGGICISQPLLQ